MKTLDELANLACKELPEEWELVIALEAGCGVINLYDPLGERCEDATNFDDPISDQLIQAVGHAKAHKEDFE